MEALYLGLEQVLKAQQKLTQMAVMQYVRDQQPHPV
jgi:hypothetical protein